MRFLTVLSAKQLYAGILAGILAADVTKPAQGLPIPVDGSYSPPTSDTVTCKAAPGRERQN
jgi:hypothetical protein